MMRKQKRMEFPLVLFIFVTLSHVTQGRSHEAPPDVNDLCEDLECPEGKVCRVVERCGKKRKSQAKCLPCVPPGVDDVCNPNHYLRAVLGGSPRNLWPLSCHLHDVLDKFECPRGSVCVENPESPGHGVCCYGKVFIPMNPHKQLTNKDEQCSKCKPACRGGFECVEDVVCGLLTNVCKPKAKPGLCLVNDDELIRCPEELGERECEHDQQCKGSMKCCEKPCGGSHCYSPTLYK